MMFESGSGSARDASPNETVPVGLADQAIGARDIGIDELEATARAVRREVVKSIAHAKGGHLGGPLSATDVLTALYFRVMDVRPDQPDWPGRDRFVLSKGHNSIALYAVLALRGYFPIDELRTFDQVGSRLQGHPDMKVLPGLDMSSGSLGLGFSAAFGMALGAKLAGAKFTTFAMLGDGECNEGIVWETAHVAHRYALDNLVAVVDQNGLQQYGWRDKVTGRHLAPYADNELRGRWASFGWTVADVDGNDMAQVMEVLEEAKADRRGPVAVIAHTVKGKGISFMEDDFTWHSRVPTDDELAAALAELSEPSAESVEG